MKYEEALRLLDDTVARKVELPLGEGPEFASERTVAERKLPVGHHDETQMELVIGMKPLKCGHSILGLDLITWTCWCGAKELEPPRVLTKRHRVSSEPTRPLQCRECRHWLTPGLPVTNRKCTHARGLRHPEPDGTSSCSYAEPRESEGER